jgi:O-antigen ligase
LSTPSIDSAHRHSGAIEAGVSFLLLALLLFAPLVKGGNRPVPLMLLELASLPLLAYLAWHAVFVSRLPRLFLFALCLFVIYPLLQWLPLPALLWQWLPGHDAYSLALAQYADQSAFSLQSMSLVSQATGAAWLSLLPPVAVLLVTMNLRDDALRRAVYVFLGMATAQAILALLQFGGGLNTSFRLAPTDFGEGVGTYVNRNHLAGLLEMALPIALGLLAASIGRKRESLRYARKGLLGKLGHALSHPPRVNAAMIFSAVSIAILLGLIFSRSRTGIVLAMAGIFLSALLYGRYIGGSRSKNLTTLFSVIGLALAIEIGLAPVLDRFSVAGALEDARWPIFMTSLAGVKEFFPFGSGLGTFPDVYWRFQPDSIGLFVNHAHNDYIEYVFEAGVVAIAVMAMLLAVYVMRWPGLLRHQHWGRQSFMQVGAGIGLFAMALHGLTDFNLHIPANAIYFAFLAGVFFHRSAARHAASGYTESMTMPTQEPALAEPLPPSVPAPRVKLPNPFSE